MTIRINLTKVVVNCTPTLSFGTREYKQLENGFSGKPYFYFSCIFFVIILKFIFTPIFLLEIFDKKNSLTQNNFMSDGRL